MKILEGSLKIFIRPLEDLEGDPEGTSPMYNPQRSSRSFHNLSKILEGPATILEVLAANLEAPPATILEFPTTILEDPGTTLKVLAKIIKDPCGGSCEGS